MQVKDLNRKACTDDRAGSTEMCARDHFGTGKRHGRNNIDTDPFGVYDHKRLTVRHSVFEDRLLDGIQGHVAVDREQPVRDPVLCHARDAVRIVSCVCEQPQRHDARITDRYS